MIIMDNKKIQETVEGLAEQKDLLYMADRVMLALHGANTTRTVMVSKNLAKDIMTIFKWDINDLEVTPMNENASIVVIDVPKGNKVVQPKAPKSKTVKAKPAELSVAEPPAKLTSLKKGSANGSRLFVSK